MSTPRPTLEIPPEVPEHTTWLERGSVDYKAPRDAGLEEDREERRRAKARRLHITER